MKTLDELRMTPPAIPPKRPIGEFDRRPLTLPTDLAGKHGTAFHKEDEYVKLREAVRQNVATERNMEEIRKSVEDAHRKLSVLEDDMIHAQRRNEQMSLESQGQRPEGVEPILGQTVHHTSLAGSSSMDDHGGLYRIDGKSGATEYFPLMVLGNGAGSGAGVTAAADMYKRNCYYGQLDGDMPNYLGSSLYVYDEVRADDFRLIDESVNWWNRGDLYVQARKNARRDNSGDGRIYHFAEDSIYSSAENENHLYGYNIVQLYSKNGNIAMNAKHIGFAAETTGINFRTDGGDIDFWSADDIYATSANVISLSPGGDFFMNAKAGVSATFDPNAISSMTFTKGILTGYST